MKKKIASILTCILAVGLLAGCGSTTEATTDGVETTTSTTKVSLKERPVEDYVTLGSYKGIEVSGVSATVDEAELETLMLQVYTESVTKENGGIVDREVADGDTVIIDYVGYLNEVAFDGGTATGASLKIGSGQYIDGFESGLVGVMAGETVDLNLTFPETYGSEELAGQNVVFTVTVNYIIPTEIKDEVIAGFGEEAFTNAEELRQYVYNYLNESAISEYNTNVENAVLETFITSCVYTEIPQDLLEEYKENIKTSVEQTVASMGVDAETYTTYFYGMGFEDFLATYAEESVKQSIAYQAIANLENLNVDDTELQTSLEEYATKAGLSSVEDLIGENPIEDYREYFMFEKVIAFIVENAVVLE